MAVLICPSFYAAPAYLCTLNNPDRIDFGQYWYEETPTPKLFVGTQSHPPLIAYSAYMTVVSFLSYAISIFLAKKTLRELKAKSNCLSFNTKRLQNQLARYVGYFSVNINSFRTLLVQSLCPLRKTTVTQIN
jgi:hypothetical protein